MITLENFYYIFHFFVDVKDKSSFKTKKLQTLKAEAGSSYNWNTLFLGQNAVADVMASTYNTSKENVSVLLYLKVRFDLCSVL